MGEEDDDMKATQTAGYKPGEKKTLEELATLDAQDGNLKVIEKNLLRNGKSLWVLERLLVRRTVYPSCSWF
jgi:hypothetical protein